MALWPFRRKSVSKHPREGAALSNADGLPPRSRADAAVTKTASPRRQRNEPKKLQRRARTYSFSPGRNDSIRVDEERRIQRQKANGAYAVAGVGRSVSGWERTPTLYHKRDDQPTRRRSSKRRRDDHEREAEIKAMSMYMPSKSHTEMWSSDTPRKQSTKRSKTTRTTKQMYRPASNASLRLPDSIHSNTSTDSDYAAFKISGLGSLAPRPTLRYAPGSRNIPSRTSLHGPPSSPKRPLAEREVIAEDSSDPHRRIDDLADGLDASDIRELMERDNRRRERQREHDQARTERRLARKAEKQRAAAVEARKSGTPSPENLERGVAGRELVGLGIDPASAVVTSSKHRASPTPVSYLEQEKQPEPLQKFHRTGTAPLDEVDEPEQKRAAFQGQEADEPVSPLPQGAKLTGLLRSKKSRSKSTLGSDKDRSAVDDYESLRKDSDTGVSKSQRRSFTAFFKWGNKNRRSSGPSSFSNTSREEFQAAVAAQSQNQAQAEALAKLQGEEPPQPGSFAPVIAAGAATAAATAAATGVAGAAAGASTGSNKNANTLPKRTRSRFREDLPDFPISPPASRVQSPDAEPPLPSVHEADAAELSSKPIPIPGARRDVAPQHSIDGLSQTPTSMDRMSQAPSPDPAHLSISMASIDSEGSWLSGGMAKRRSQALRESVMRANRREQAHSTESPTNSTQEDLAITDDDYLSRLTPSHPTPASQFAARHSEEGRPSSDDEDVTQGSELKWGAVGARPEIVHKPRDTMHSFHGLLNMDSSDESGESPISPSVVANASLERATSVNVPKGHGRNFSAGSAKLLDVTPRVSVDGKRLSHEDH